MAPQASELYAQTVSALLELVTKDGARHLDYDDEVQRGPLVVHEGKITWPPPKLAIRAGAPAAGVPTGTHKTLEAPPPASPWPMRIGARAGAAASDRARALRIAVAARAHDGVPARVHRRLARRLERDAGACTRRS